MGDEEEVAKMGCPSLGEHTKLEVVIEESYEFKVTPPHPKEPRPLLPPCNIYLPSCQGNARSAKSV